jgi:asparagine synthase (glutamine-hydrolysing)
MRSTLPLPTRVSYADVRFRLLEDMLVKVDRMSMAHSLEVRSPLLDHRLVELAVMIPPDLRLRGWQTKAILRDVARRYLPAQTLTKRKQGFSVPLRDWLRGPLSEMVSDYFDGTSSSPADSVLDRSAIRRLVAQHKHGEADHSTVLWLLLNYQAWCNIYLSAPAAVAYR